MYTMATLNLKKIAILTSKNSWFMPYAKKLVKALKSKDYKAKLFNTHEDIEPVHDVVFMLSYFHVLSSQQLKKHKKYLVVHESDLPKGRGWAPLFWQILEGKKKIPIVLFEAVPGTDRGPVYLKDTISLHGHELYDEIRHLQAEKTCEMCLRFLKNYKQLKVIDQKGKPTAYRRRMPCDNKLRVDLNIRDQFNLLRIANNREFPAFFNFKGHKYTIRITKDE